jgi:hypothetical protein
MVRRYIIALALLAVPLWPGLAAAEDGEIHVRDTIEGIISSDCTGEVIAYSGTFHLLVREVTDASGNHHTVNHSTIQATGTGLTSGRTYRFTNATNEVGISRFEDGNTGGIVGHATLVARGRGNNVVMRFLMRLTQNANGEWTASPQMDEIDCRG